MKLLKPFLIIISILISISSVYSIISDDNLIAYWEMDGDLTNSYGPAPTLTNNGAVSTTINCAGGATNCYAFDGTTDYVYANGFSQENSQMTFGGWVYFGSDTSSQSDIFSKYSGGGKIFHFRANQGTKTMRLYCGGFNNIETTGGYSVSTAYHMVAKINGNVAEIYVDGVIAQNASCTSSTNAVDWWLGQNPVGGSNFNGTMNRMAIWNRSLSETEILDWYNNGITVVTAGKIQTNITGNYSTPNFSLGVNTTDLTLTNMSYILDGGTEVFFANNTNLTTVSFSGLSIGNHNLSFKSNQTGTVEWTNYTFAIQPNQYFRFNDSVTGGYLTDYTFAGVASVGEYVTLNNTHLSLGSNSLLFTKAGYNNRTINLNFTNTDQLNSTYEVNPVTLNIKIYDADTFEQLTFNITILNSTHSETYNNQVNFSRNYNATITGEIEMIVSSDGYDSATFYNTLGQYTSITLAGYLYNSTVSSVVQFTVTDLTDNAPLENVNIEVQKLINGTWTTLSEQQTGSTGKAYFYLDTSISYKLIFTKDGYVTATSNTIPTVTEYTVQLTESATSYGYVEDLSYKFTPTQNSLDDNKTYVFSGFLSGDSLTSIQYQLWYDNGTMIYSDSSTNPTGSTFTTSLYLPYQINISYLLANITYVKDGQTNVILKNYSIYSLDNDTFIQQLKQFGNDNTEDSKILRWLIIMATTVIVLVNGALLGIPGVNLLIIPELAFFSYIGWLEWYIAAVAIFISLVFFIGGRR